MMEDIINITAYDIFTDTEQAVEVSDNLSTYYMKGSTTVEPKVVCFDRTLVKGKDYTLKYANNKKVGENKATVTITGKGNYTGELSCTYRIVKANISKATAKIATQTYTGKAITLEEADIPLKIGKNKLEETDFEIVSYSNNIRKGTATVIVKGTGNYGGTKKLTFKIKAKKFSWWWR